MGALMRAYDWSGSPLGSPEKWPQSLRAMIRVMLNTNHPMWIWWGPDLIQFYNDAYRETMGPEMHPSALGAKGRESWHYIWHIIGPQIEHVMAGEGSTWDVERLVPILRHGGQQNVWWTYSYGPIDLEGQVGGVLVVCNDVTEQHLAKQALHDQTRRFEQLFEQAPGFMTVLRGPCHVFELANAAYRRLIGGRDIIGKPAREALPEIDGQGFFELLDRVYRTGEAYVGRRQPLTLPSEIEGQPKDVFLDFVYQPIVECSGDVSGIFVEGVDVTDHVRTEQHARLMNDELKHRIKNTLATVSAIASQTLRGSAKVSALETFHARIAAFGKAHDILTDANMAAASVHDVVDGALAPHRMGNGRISLSGPEIALASRQALSLALAVHELATNAIKYGALSGGKGHVDISWLEEREDDVSVFRFTWQEAGGPLVSKPLKKGFGSQLIERVLAADFGGKVEVAYEPTGVICRFTAPMENINQALPGIQKGG
jgi:two-component sensor histidine kinase